MSTTAATTPERQIVERYLAAYNAFDVDGMLTQLAPQVRFEHHAGGELGVATDGIDAFRALAEQALAMFAAREQRILTWEQAAAQADGRSTAHAAIAWRGRLAADPDTELALQGASAFEFVGDRIVRIVDRA